jgi:SNF2 family DNA or RNA helicase
VSVAVVDEEIEAPVAQIGDEQAWDGEEAVILAVRYLAGHCDGARTLDGHGFNRLHAAKGQVLAEKPTERWTKRDVWAAWRMIQTYKNTQLKGIWGAIPAQIEEPPRDAYDAARRAERAAWQAKAGVVPEPMFRRLANVRGRWVGRDFRETDDGLPYVVLQHSYDKALIDRVKRLPQARWDKRLSRWLVPVQLDALEALVDFATDEGYEIPPDVQETLIGTIEHFTEKADLSRAASSDFDVPGLGKQLFPFQRAGVEFAVKAENVLIADEMGLGKTIQALAVLKHSGLFPAVVVCPASLKRNWEREARAVLGDKLRIAVLNGRTHALTFMGNEPIYDLLIVNYNSKILDKWAGALVSLQPKAWVLDEAHNCKNAKAQQTKLVDFMLTGTPEARRLFLTGTPVVNRPMEFWTLIKLLGYASFFGGKAEYERRYDTTLKSRLHELSNRCRTSFMVRRLKMDVLKELPPKLRTIVPLELDNRPAYEAAAADVAHYFATKKSEDQTFVAESRQYAIDHGLIDPAQIDRFVALAQRERYSAASMIASRAEQLIRWEALKQAAVAGKMAAVEQWIDEFLDSTDKKLVVFASHTAIVERLAARYRAPYIHGQVPPDRRQPLVQQFQEDPGTRVIVGNLQAMGEGLTLTAASDVAMVELGWNPKTMDQAEDRCHRIGQHDTVNVWYLVARDTIEDELAQLIESKRAVVDAIQDGDGGATQAMLMDALRARLDAKLGRAS